MTDLVLYGHPDSGHACKVALALSLAGLPNRTTWVDIWAAPETRPREFLAHSPLGEVPLLMIDGAPYFQSGAILLEIANRFGCLGGKSVDGVRRGRELLMWEGNRIGMCVPQLKEARRVAGAAFPPDVIEWLKSRFEVDRERFDLLLGDAPFFHGTSPGIGDCAIWGYTQWVTEAGLEPTRAMVRWLGRIGDLPGTKTPHEFFPPG